MKRKCQCQFLVSVSVISVSKKIKIKKEGVLDRISSVEDLEVFRKSHALTLKI